MKTNIMKKLFIVSFVLIQVTGLFASPAVSPDPHPDGQAQHVPGENPLIQDVFTADPAALVYKDTVYLYVGHDEAKGKEMFTMKEWLCYSSKDMKTWTSHGSILKPTDFAWGEKDAWASQVVEKDGKFYFFTTVQHKAPDVGKAIGVAVSDSPTGLFKDARGSALIVDKMTKGRTGWNDIDPTVFTDADGTSWLCWGNGDCYMARLKPNMTELDGPIERIELPNYVEGPWLHKRGDLYYLTYAMIERGPGKPQAEQIGYATAPAITGPWTSRGKITGPARNSFTIHPAIIEFKGQWYFFYHNAALTLPNGESGALGRRAVCLEYLDYNPDGTIQPIEQTTQGVSVPSNAKALGQLAQAQTAPLQAGGVAEDFKPSSINQPGKQYPQVNSERRVRARIVAPQAQNIQLDLGGKKYPLAKGEDGAWVGTSDPQDEGFHYYQIVVDGAQVPDPNSLYFYGCGRWGSGVEVPAPDQDFYALKDVPHGQLRENLYLSKITNAWRRSFIYTPPDYDQDPSRRYPVLYLQHGSGEDETGWGDQGKANLILDNLIAGKKAVPMIIVMDNGYASKPGSEVGRGNSAFEEVVIRELIPMIDTQFRTFADREHRAMAGLSMGGNQTCQVTFHNLDQFAWIGAFSGTMNGLSTEALDPATAFDGLFKDGEALNKKIKLLWLGLGTKEPNPFPGSVGAFRAMLDKAGVKYVFYESPGTAHEWLTWRRDLSQFAPLLFKD